jgi:hypothetical protein
MTNRESITPVLIAQFFRQYRTFFAITSFFLVMQLTTWPPLRFWGWWGGGNFLDSWQVLTSSDCYRSIGLQVYELDNPCMIYAYGRPLLVPLAELHIGASQTSLFGIIFLIFVSATISIMIKSLDYPSSKKTLVAIIVALCPPVLLLVDRGNFDSLIVFMVLLAAWIHAKGNSITATLLIFLTATFKYYTAPLLLLMVLISKDKISKGVAALLSLVAALSILRDLKITQFTFTTTKPNLTFGLGHEFLYMSNYNSLDWMEKYRQVGGAVVVLICFGACFMWLRKKAIDLNVSRDKAFTRNLYVFSTSVIVSCYFTGVSADYRLIFLLISGITLLSTVRISAGFDTVALHVICGILWLTFPSGDFEIIGDALLSVYIGFSGAFLLKLIIEKKLTLLFK